MDQPPTMSEPQVHEVFYMNGRGARLVGSVLGAEDVDTAVVAFADANDLVVSTEAFGVARTRHVKGRSGWLSARPLQDWERLTRIGRDERGVRKDYYYRDLPGRGPKGGGYYIRQRVIDLTAVGVVKAIDVEDSSTHTEDSSS